MPYLAESHRILLEHLLCFLVNAARPYWAETPDYRQHLARVWAPCILRAPARIMSKFQGRVVDVMGMCVLTLLEARAGPGAHYGARDRDHYGASAGEGSGGVGDGQGGTRRSSAREQLLVRLGEEEDEEHFESSAPAAAGALGVAGGVAGGPAGRCRLCAGPAPARAGNLRHERPARWATRDVRAAAARAAAAALAVTQATLHSEAYLSHSLSWRAHHGARTPTRTPRSSPRSCGWIGRPALTRSPNWIRTRRSPQGRGPLRWDEPSSAGTRRTMTKQAGWMDNSRRRHRRPRSRRRRRRRRRSSSSSSSSAP